MLTNNSIKQQQCYNEGASFSDELTANMQAGLVHELFL